MNPVQQTTTNLLLQLTNPAVSQADKARLLQNALDEVHALRSIFPQIAKAMGNGSTVSEEASIEFLQEIPREAALVISRITRERDIAVSISDTAQNALHSAAAACSEMRNHAIALIKEVGCLSDDETVDGCCKDTEMNKSEYCPACRLEESLIRTVGADRHSPKEVQEALKILWSIGLLPEAHDTLEKAAKGALSIVTHLRDDIAEPRSDIQELVLQKLGIREEMKQMRIRIAELEQQKRIASCVWCGATVATYQGEMDDIDKQAAARFFDLCREHDTNCECNPLHQKLIAVQQQHADMTDGALIVVNGLQARLKEAQQDSKRLKEEVVKTDTIRRLCEPFTNRRTTVVGMVAEVVERLKNAINLNWTDADIATEKEDA